MFQPLPAKGLHLLFLSLLFLLSWALSTEWKLLMGQVGWEKETADYWPKVERREWPLVEVARGGSLWMDQAKMTQDQPVNQEQPDGDQMFPLRSQMCVNRSHRDPSTWDLPEISGAQYNYTFPTLPKHASLFLTNYSYKQTTVTSIIKTRKEKY